MFKMLVAIIIFLVLFALTLGICAAFEENLFQTLLKVVLIPGVTTLVYYFAPKVSPVLAMALLVAITIIMLFMVFWWFCDGSTVRELLMFFGTDLILLFVAQMAAVRIVDITDIRVVVGLIRVIPLIMFIMSIGGSIANMIWFKNGLKSDDFDPYDYLTEEVKGR